jgi:hypothetical protein
MANRPCRILPNGDQPTRGPNKSYLDKMGSNPMKKAYDNCYIKTALGTDPITGRPVTVWSEQIDREQQLLESTGEQVLFFRLDQTPDKNVDGGRRCPICWDPIRQQARSSCTSCNGMGVTISDPNITRIKGYEWLQNPDQDNRMFFVHQTMVPGKFESRDTGLYQVQNPRFWTVPVRNCDGVPVNILTNRDVMIRFIFDLGTHAPIRELGRYELINSSYSLGPDNQLLHMEFDCEQLNPGVDSKQYALPNFLS